MSPESTSPTGQALPAGTRLEEFEVESVLGRGGFGITYLARDASLGRKVVIKENLPAMFAYRETTSGTVRPQSESGEDADNFRWSMQNFLREADTLASLDHPGIVSVLRKFEANGTAYFVMPHVEGLAFDTLESSRQEKGQWFTEDELRGLLEHVLDALGYLHSRGIYHRDIKPGNILITMEGVPILIDFGSARQRLSERSMTVVESAGYTPFEQLESRGNVGPWSDLYALGATVVRVVTGQAPPKANDRMRNDPYEPLSRRPNLRERYSGVLLGSIDRALEVEESARWQDAGQWQRGLSMGEQLASREEQSVPPVPGAESEPFSAEVSGNPAGVSVGAVSPGPKGKGKGMLIAVGAATLLAMGGVALVMTSKYGAGVERVRLVQEEKEAAWKKAEEKEAAREKTEAALAARKKTEEEEAAREKAEAELAADRKKADDALHADMEELGVAGKEEAAEKRKQFKGGLVAYYPFNGNAKDESGNGNDGTVHGATLTADRNGDTNSAYNFDGTGYIDCPDGVYFDGDFTVFGWVNLREHSNWGRLIDFANTRDDHVTLTLSFQNSGRPRGDVIGNNNSVLSEEALPLNRWAQVSWTFTQNTTTLYINGQAVAEETWNSPPASVVRTDNWIGRSNWEDAAGVERTNGILDDIRIYNRALSAKEVSELYELEKSESSFTDGLVAYYPFNGNAKDESGNGNDGEVKGATLTTDRHGKQSSAYSFDGKDDFIEVSHSSELNFERTLCIAFWMKPDSWGGRPEEVGGIVSKMPDINTVPYAQGYAVYHDFNRNGKMSFRYNGEGLNQQDSPRAISESNASVGEWEHWAVIYDGDSVSWYRNGALDKRHDNLFSVIRMVTDVPLHIGHAQHWDGWGFKTYYDGQIDDVRIYNRALSDAEVGALYELEKPGAELTPGAMSVITKALKLIAWGEKIAPDFFEKVDRKILSSAAEDGDPRAQFVWGRLHVTGVGLLNDNEDALKWYRKAAAQDYARAQTNLGIMYAQGRGVAKDEAEAVEWFRKAAKQDLEIAQNALAIMYEHGQGVEQDKPEAVKLYRKAAEQGFVVAQSNLGKCYDNGQGVEKNYVEAVKWYRKAAEQGDAGAMLNLGLNYASGHGVVQNYVEAAKWYRLAAKQGDSRAMFNLGAMYHNGEGVAKDAKKAAEWFRKAAVLGDARAKEVLRRLGVRE